MKPFNNMDEGLNKIEEEQILKRAASGEQEAFGYLYEKYVTRIYNYIFYRTGNSADAEDLTAKVFLRAMRHIRSYQDLGLPFSAWLYRIAHNLVANWHRDNGRKKEIPLDEGLTSIPLTKHPETEVVYLEEQERLLRIIRKLPAERQQLIILKFVEQLPNSEIGQIMGKSEGAIKSLYHRTLLSLRKEYEIYFLDDEEKEPNTNIPSNSKLAKGNFHDNEQE
ncbi:MAG: RNA polymerase sigma factor [Anaerolineales bacterium]